MRLFSIRPRAMAATSFVGSVLLLVAALALPGVRRVYAAGVVGTGTPASCTEAALKTALTGGGAVTFNCGGPATITISAALDISAPDTTIDGGGQITLQGNNTRIIRHHSLSSASVLTLRGLTLTKGRASGADNAANGAGVQSVFEGAQPTFKPTLNIIGVTFTDNDATVTAAATGDFYDYGGGAIFTQGGALSVLGSTFSGNDASNGAGGAIHALQSTLSIADSIFATNSAIGSVPKNSQGGAIYIDGVGGASGSARIARSNFTSNTSYNSGGAIYVNMYENTNQFSVDSSTFKDNAIVGGDGALGGAISGGSSTFGANSGNASVTISNSTFSGNSAKRSGSPADGSGGALAFAQTAVIKISNSTFSANRAEGSSYNANGGALYVVNNSTPFEVTNSTIANNYAGWVGGGISNSDIGGNPGGVLKNVILANNTAGGIANFQQHCSSELTEVGANLQYPPRLTDGNYFNDVTCFKGKSAPSQTSLPAFRDPKLDTLKDNGGATLTMALLAGSPAINAGGDCPASDQRGAARVGACDLGAFEFGSGPATSTPTTVTPTTVTPTISTPTTVTPTTVTPTTVTPTTSTPTTSTPTTSTPTTSTPTVRPEDLKPRIYLPFVRRP